MFSSLYCFRKRSALYTVLLSKYFVCIFDTLVHWLQEQCEVHKWIFIFNIYSKEFITETINKTGNDIKLYVQHTKVEYRWSYILIMCIKMWLAHQSTIGIKKEFEHFSWLDRFFYMSASDAMGKYLPSSIRSIVKKKCVLWIEWTKHRTNKGVIVQHEQVMYLYRWTSINILL